MKGLLARFVRPTILALVVGTTERSAASDLEYPNCDSLAQCASLGAAAYKKGDYAQAKDYFEQQVGEYEQEGKSCAQGAHRCLRSATPYNNVALALLKSGQPLKAQAWLEVAPADPVTEHNMHLVERALNGWKWPGTPEGEYWLYAGYGSWSTVTVIRDGGKWSIQYSGIRFPGSGMRAGPNIGEFDTEMPFEARTATYSEEGCRVLIVFSSDRVSLEQDDSRGACAGFGYGVNANGIFKRVSTGESPAAK